MCAHVCGWRRSVRAGLRLSITADDGGDKCLLTDWCESDTVLPAQAELPDSLTLITVLHGVSLKRADVLHSSAMKSEQKRNLIQQWLNSEFHMCN